MVRTLFKFCIYLTIFLSALVYLSPKRNLYFFLQQKVLSSYDIKLQNKQITDNGFKLNINNSTVYVKSIKTAHIDKITFKPWIVYDKLQINGVVLTNAVSAYLPRNISVITAQYSILEPLLIKAYAKGGFGSANIKINLAHRQIVMILHPSLRLKTQFQASLNMLHKINNKEYKYEQKF